MSTVVQPMPLLDTERKPSQFSGVELLSPAVVARPGVVELADPFHRGAPHTPSAILSLSPGEQVEVPTTVFTSTRRNRVSRQAGVLQLPPWRVQRNAWSELLDSPTIGLCHGLDVVEACSILAGFRFPCAVAAWFVSCVRPPLEETGRLLVASGLVWSSLSSCINI